jgi:hypothetical protein
LHKVLAHDISHLSKCTSAYIENDAVGCYDRMVNNLLLLLLRWLGFATSISSCLGALWSRTTHSIKTLHGISSSTYTNSIEHPLFGPGQGSTTGPPFWLVVFFAIVESLDPTIGHSIFTSVSGCIRVNSTGTAFVDDSSLGVTSTYQWDPNLTSVENQNEEIRRVMGRFRKLAQHWERLLFSTGGAINTQKSHSYILTWRWKNGNVSFLNSVASISTLNLTSGYDTRAHPVPSLPATLAYHTLGVHISPSGSQTQHIKVFRSHANEYHSTITNSTLMPDEAIGLISSIYDHVLLIPSLLRPLQRNNVAMSKPRHWLLCYQSFIWIATRHIL